jgi:hypothetical protein
MSNLDAGPVLLGWIFDALVCETVHGVILPRQRRALWDRYQVERPADVVAWIRDAMRSEKAT